MQQRTATMVQRRGGRRGHRVREGMERHHLPPVRSGPRAGSVPGDFLVAIYGSAGTRNQAPWASGAFKIVPRGSTLICTRRRGGRGAQWRGRPCGGRATTGRTTRSGGGVGCLHACWFLLTVSLVDRCDLNCIRRSGVDLGLRGT